MIVPALDGGGGVPAVARFVHAVARAAGRHEVKLISLAMSRNDSASVLLARPATWMRGPQSVRRTWGSLRFEHIGALGAEVEFQKYLPRRRLAETLAGCDVVQVICGSAAWANAVVGSGRPISLSVATRARVERRVRDAKPSGMVGWWRKGMTAITDRLDDRALRCADAIQVMNPWMLDYVHALNAGRSVDLRYAPPGVDDILFHPLPSRDPEADAYILCVGRFDDPRKNVGLLVNAYGMLPGTLRERVRLVLAGPSKPPQSFWARAERLGVARTIEYVAGPSIHCLVELYQRASVFALPSDEEGFGVVLLEAMACGIPVVSTRSGGPDGIVTDGSDGFLVSLDDAQAMSDRLVGLLRRPDVNLAMGRQARHTIEARYTERIAGEVYLDVWDRLLTKRSVAPCAD